MPSTCAHTATVARNRPNDAKARASSQTDRIIGNAPSGMKGEHSSLFVLSQEHPAYPKYRRQNHIICYET
jgi:hypothetical protein